MEFKKELEKLKRLGDGFNALKERKKKIKELLEVKTKELGERIKQGESTGDPVKDYCIICYGYAPMLVNIAEKNCHHLIEKTEGRTGEFVLLVQRQKDVSDDSRIFGLEPEIREELFLGVLENDNFVVDPAQRKCGFPTDKFVRVERESIDVQEGVLVGSQFFGDILTGWNIPLELGAKVNRIEIKVGDEEVRAWFEEQGKIRSYYLVLFKKMVQLLRRSITESPVTDTELEEKAREKIKRITELETKEKKAREIHQEIIGELQEAVEMGLTKNLAIRELCKKYEVDLPEE